MVFKPHLKGNLKDSSSTLLELKFSIEGLLPSDRYFIHIIYVKFSVQITCYCWKMFAILCMCFYISVNIATPTSQSSLLYSKFNFQQLKTCENSGDSGIAIAIFLHFDQSYIKRLSLQSTRNTILIVFNLLNRAQVYTVDEKYFIEMHFSVKLNKKVIS